MVNRYVLPSVILCILLIVQGAAAEKPALQDPLRPVRYQAPTEDNSSTSEVEKSWHLSAVLRSDARSVAVINGQVVQVGEMFDGYKVVKIESGKVLLAHNKKTIVLQRAGTGLKRVSSSQGIGKGSRP